jgi:hypothetical protein
MKTTSVEFVITQDFVNLLTEQEKTILENILAGYTQKVTILIILASNPSENISF